MEQIYDNIRIEGENGTWYEINRKCVNDKLYVFFESSEEGEDEPHILCEIPPINKLLVKIKYGEGIHDEVILRIPKEYVLISTWDDMEEALAYQGIEEPENVQNEALEEEIEQMSIVLDRMRKISREWKK